MQNVIIRDFMKKEDLMSLLPCCDFFITLSLQDIYGHTTNEAMAKGLPVISSKNVVSSLHLIMNRNESIIINHGLFVSIHMVYLIYGSNY